MSMVAVAGVRNLKLMMKTSGSALGVARLQSRRRVAERECTRDLVSKMGELDELPDVCKPVQNVNCCCE